MRQGAEVKLRWTIAGLGGAVFGTAAMVDETRLPIQVVRRLISRMVRAGSLTRLGPDRWKEVAGRLDHVRMAMRPRSEAVPREARVAGPQTPCDLPQEKP